MNAYLGAVFQGSWRRFGESHLGTDSAAGPQVTRRRELLAALDLVVVNAGQVNRGALAAVYFGALPVVVLQAPHAHRNSARLDHQRVADL
jgi:hypothetical protein